MQILPEMDKEDRVKTKKKHSQVVFSYTKLFKLSIVFYNLSGADPGGVDWVASHPPLEQPTKKNIYLFI